MTGPDPADAGQPDNTATPEQIAALVASLNIPHRGPHTVYEVCPCCKQPTGTYWAIPRGWEPTEGRRKPWRSTAPPSTDG